MSELYLGATGYVTAEHLVAIRFSCLKATGKCWDEVVFEFDCDSVINPLISSSPFLSFAIEQDIFIAFCSCFESVVPFLLLPVKVIGLDSKACSDGFLSSRLGELQLKKKKNYYNVTLQT